MLLGVMVKAGRFSKKQHNWLQRFYVQKMHFEDGKFKARMLRTC